MKIRFNKNHLDYQEGKEYDVFEPTAVYLVRLGVAKEVTGKDGKAPKAKAPAKPKAPKKVKEAKAPVETKELKVDIENK